MKYVMIYVLYFMCLRNGNEVSHDLCFVFQIYVSKKWGFTKYERDLYEQMQKEGRLQHDGCNVKYRPEHGSLDVWRKAQLEIVSAD